MKPIAFADIRRILELRESTHVNPSPIAEVPDRWALYFGENIVLRYRYPVYFLYLMRDCTLDDIPNAGSAIVDSRVTDVIYAASLDKVLRRDPERESDVQHWLRKPRDIVSATKFLNDLLHDTLAVYREKLAGLKPSYFVDPPVETSGAASRPFSRPLHAHLSKANPAASGLGVLLAEAGQGKTHTTKQLAATVRTSIPIYVDSRLWRHVTPEHLSDPWKTMTSSFSWFGTPIPWTVDAENDFISIMMRAGVLSLIFDGFDEYIYWNRGRLDPIDTLRSLSTLADDSSSGVLITSRTSFWETDVARNDIVDISHTVFQLVPFDRSHAATFFVQRLRDELPTARAMAVYDSLRSTDVASAVGFVGRGFVLELLADLVARTDGIPSLPSGASVSRRVMLAMCERESERQDLPLDAASQLRAFGIFAESIAAGQPPTGEMLQIAITLTDETLDPDTLAGLVLVGEDTAGLSGKLAQHPLLERHPSRDEWRIRQDQVYYDLLAEQLLLCRDRDDPILRDFVVAILPDAKVRADIATVLLDQACSSPLANAQDTIRFTIAKLLSYSTELPTHSPMPERDLATAIALLALNRFEPVGRQRTERTRVLLDLLPQHELIAQQFSGTITSLDFCGQTFSGCRFDNVAWVNCSFDGSTVFTNCRFIGGRIEHCDGFGLAEMLSIWSDPEASTLIKTEQILSNARDYDIADLRRDIALLVRKFVPREGYGIKTLEERYLRSGSFNSSPHRDKILNAFRRHVLASHSVGGGRPAVHVRDEARNDLLFFATNGVMTGQLARAYAEIVTDIGLA